MADTITVLDGILFDKPDTADVWTCDAADISCVQSFPVLIPSNVSGARVVFNSAEATAATRFHVRVNVTKLTVLTSGSAPTKTENTLALEWTILTPPAVLKTGAIDLSAAIEAMLHIDCVLTDVTACTAGPEIIVQVRKKASLDEWTDLTRVRGITGTAFTADMDDAVQSNLAGQTVLGVTNPATGNLDHVGKRIFLEDTATIAHCEIAFLVSQTGN